jgi:hypothetical protein
VTKDLLISTIKKASNYNTAGNAAEAGYKGPRDLFLAGLAAQDLLLALFLGTAPSQLYEAWTCEIISVTVI